MTDKSEDTGEPMRFRDVYPLFESPPVRVLLNRDSLHEMNPKVSVKCVHLEDLDWLRLLPPWYVDDTGKMVDFDAVGARPISFGELAGSRDTRLSESREAKVQLLVEEMIGMKPPIFLPLPTYAVAGQTNLVLDGNHRVLAAISHGIRVTALVVALHGPIDPGLLPDLVHW